MKKTVNKEELTSAPKHVKKEDVYVPQTESAMPFPTLKLLQQLSPELDEDNVTKYLPKAAPGMFVVTDGAETSLLNGEKGIDFCPLVVKKVYNEWVPRKSGGGFVASYATKEEAEASFTVGNELNISIDYLIVSTDVTKNGAMYPFIVQFNTPTKMAAARELQKFIQSYKTMHGVTYHLNSKKQANKAGQKFFNFMITTVDWTKKDLYEQLDSIKKEREMLFLPILDESSF